MRRKRPACEKGCEYSRKPVLADTQQEGAVHICAGCFTMSLCRRSGTNGELFWTAVDKLTLDDETAQRLRSLHALLLDHRVYLRSAERSMLRASAAHAGALLRAADTTRY